MTVSFENIKGTLNIGGQVAGNDIINGRMRGGKDPNLKYELTTQKPKSIGDGYFMVNEDAPDDVSEMRFTGRPEEFFFSQKENVSLLYVEGSFTYLVSE